MLLASRWRVSPAVVAFGLGLAMGRPGLGLIQPQLTEEGGQVETVCQIALLTSLFCVSLRLQAPLVWSRWRVPVRLTTLSLPVACLLAAAAAKALFELSIMQSLLIATVLAPTDAVLAADAAGGLVETEADSSAPTALAAEGAFSSALAVPAVALVLGFMGLESKDSGSVGWPALGTAWATLGGIASGAAIGAGMSRWIALLDFDRQTDVLEPVVVFTTAALAYGGAEAIHTSGFLAVVAAGLALAHGGRWGTRRRKRALSSGVLKIAARVDRAAVLCVVMLVGAMSPDMDFRFRALAFAAILLGFIRPLAVRLGLSVLAPATPQRKQIEWVGVRGAASLYCLAFAIDHGLGGRFGHQLVGLTLVVMAGSILAHGLTASPVRTASPGALSS